MTPGKVYSVSKQSSDFLIEHNRAVPAKDSEKVGKVYDIGKTPKNKE